MLTGWQSYSSTNNGTEKKTGTIKTQYGTIQRELTLESEGPFSSLILPFTVNGAIRKSLELSEAHLFPVCETKQMYFMTGTYRTVK